MNRPLLLLFLVLISLFSSELCHAQERQRIDGGMMVHSGYLHGNIKALNYEANGLTFGLGGVLRFHLGNHFRVGGEGYVSTLRQMGNGSYIRTSWGGLLVDAYRRYRQWQPFVGLTIGGGKTSTLLIFDGADDDWMPESHAVLHNENFIFINPHIGMEFALTHSIHLTFKVDRLVTLSPIEMPAGTRAYLGIVFAH